MNLPKMTIGSRIKYLILAVIIALFTIGFNSLYSVSQNSIASFPVAEVKPQYLNDWTPELEAEFQQRAKQVINHFAKAEADEAKLLLVREAERERLLAEEAKEQLTKKSAEADRARMARAEKDWLKLQEKSRTARTECCSHSGGATQYNFRLPSISVLIIARSIMA